MVSKDRISEGRLSFRQCKLKDRKGRFPLMGVAENYKHVLEGVEARCIEDGRDPDSVLLLAVSKTTDIDGVREAMSAGARDFGENRPDELLRKHAEIPEVNWHFIGNIQSRRIKDIVSCACLIHSLFERRHADKISKAAESLGKVQDVLIEVNVSGEESKSGLDPQDLPEMLEHCSRLDDIRVRGLMTMAPQGDMEAARDCFEGLAALLDERRGFLGEKGECFDQLSMGMTEDWPEAIDEGSTIVRVGRAIFNV